ncbi:MAG: hypothetical protein EOP63_03385 [Sphingomonadales bacterium]|nr:MAG: hypothetical protein EOP63_03385 [Sphingomonadales bacterium]
MRPIPLLAAVALFAAPLPAFACSVAPGYHVPTNLELVDDADLILLGTVTEGDFEPDSTPEQMIGVEPVAALKGTMPNAPIALPATIAADADAQLSNPYQLKDAHPQSLAGACVRYVFPRGSRVLFFLARQDGAWHPAGGPFSRWAEDVLTDDAPWLQAVRFYIDIAKLPEEDRAAALAARRDELGALGDDPVAQLIAADIDRQLAGPNAPLKGSIEFVPAEPDAPREAMDAADAAAEAAIAGDQHQGRRCPSHGRASPSATSTDPTLVPPRVTMRSLRP